MTPAYGEGEAGRRSQVVGGVEWIYYSVGETAAFANESVTLNSAEVNGDRLSASITVLNTSADQVLSGYGMFEAFQETEEGRMRREESAANCPGQFTALDRIEPGESMTRNLCWKGVASERFEITFRPTGDSGGQKAVIFQFEP